MKGIRFYADPCGTAGYDGDKPPTKLTRRDYRALAKAGRRINCIAVFQGREHLCHDFTQEALVATFAYDDSDVSVGSVSRGYLTKCRHIDEATAAQLHPRLAARLTQEG